MSTPSPSAFGYNGTHALLFVAEHSAETCCVEGSYIRNFHHHHEERLGHLFGMYGRFVARHPVKILAIAIIVNLLMGLGMLNFYEETNLEKLYTPENSQASQDWDKLKGVYPHTPDFYPHKGLASYAEVLIMTKDKGNMLTLPFLDDVTSVDRFVRTSISITVSGEEYKYEDLCGRAEGSCVVDGDIFLSTDFKEMMLANNITYPIFKGKSITSLLANPTTSDEILTSAIGVKLSYHLLSYHSAEWEKVFIEAIPAAVVNVSELAFSYSLAADDELTENIKGDIVLYVTTLLFMMIYASIATSNLNGNFIADRAALGQAGVLAALLSILSSLGFLSLVGVKFVNIVGAMPFLVIGIGIDDVFLLLSGLADAESIETTTVSDRIYYMMKTSGVAITITSVTDFLAFLIGASSVFISVRNFCIFTGVAVLFCYINQITIFCACIVLNEKRIKSNRHCFACCVKTKDKNSLKEDGKTGFSLYACAGYAPKHRDDVDSPLERYPKRLIQKILSYTVLKIAIIVIFVIYLICSINGAVNIQEGLSLRNLAPEDSFYYKFNSWLEDYFTRETFMSFNVMSTQTYSSSLTQETLEAVLSMAKDDKYIDSSFEINWLDTFKKSALYVNSSETEFISALRTFLITNPIYASDVVFDSSGTAITNSRFFLKTIDMKNTVDQGLMMKSMREVVKGSPIPMIVYAQAFIYFEQFIQVLSSTLQTVGVAIVVIVIVTLFFMPQPSLVLLVALSLLSILLGVFGFMYYWDISLSSITMIHLIMTVGFSVDFSAHICHAYLNVGSFNRATKVDLALDRSGGPIFNGAFSTLVGISVLGFANSYIFETFAKVMFLVIFFGLIHSVLLIPVVLSFIGPVKDKEEAMREIEIRTIQRQTSVTSNTSAKSDQITGQNSVPKNTTAEKKDIDGKLATTCNLSTSSA
ncbi:patched domain-containing protein 3-like [Saccostrea cucullata]|uniref:patched domain-containing protein 3-like n=1 Tax=Saccostrea cuccullata TaxID=36930 RepID=UPI002ED262D6